MVTDEYLAECGRLSAAQIGRYLEDFRLLHGPPRVTGTTLVSIRIQSQLLDAFKLRARLDGVPYQTRIKHLMRSWLQEEG